MENALYNAANSLTSLQRWQEMTTQNIAASSVPGFKGQKMSFEAIHTGKMGVISGDQKVQMPVTMSVAKPVSDFSDGILKQTGAPSHVAIKGDGFFHIKGDSFDYFTRDGEFHVDPQNQLVNKMGDPVLGKTGAPIRIQPDQGEFTISANGEIRQGLNQVGELGVFDFENREDLIRVPGGFRTDPEKNMQTEEVNDSRIMQGHLEESNMSALSQMVDLISVSRAFELNHKVIQNIDEKMGKAIEVLGATG